MGGQRDYRVRVPADRRAQELLGRLIAEVFDIPIGQGENSLGARSTGREQISRYVQPRAGLAVTQRVVRSERILVAGSMERVGGSFNASPKAFRQPRALSVCQLRFGDAEAFCNVESSRDPDPLRQGYELIGLGAETDGQQRFIRLVRLSHRSTLIGDGQRAADTIFRCPGKGERFLKKLHRLVGGMTTGKAGIILAFLSTPHRVSSHRKQGFHFHARHGAFPTRFLSSGREPERILQSLPTPHVERVHQFVG